MIGAPPDITACPICKSRDVGVKYDLKDYNVATCRRCGFLFNANFTGGGSDGELFSDDYYRVAHGAAFNMQFEDYRKDPSTEVFDRWLQRIEARLGPGRVLDVGSALGTFLKTAQDRGWSPQGVEISDFASNFARETHGLDVFTGDLEDFDGVDGTYDLITFWDSIEHVRYPLENMQTAHRLLRPGGLVLFTTDNFDCLIADVAKLLYRLSRGTIRYPIQRLFIDRNFAFFTEHTFRSLIERLGWRIVEFEKMEYPLEKIDTNRFEEIMLRCFYGLAKCLGRQAQFTMVAEKR